MHFSQVDRMTNVLVDTHCHLDLEVFQNDRHEVIQKALEVGLIRMLNPGIDLSSSKETLQIAESYKEVYAAVGVHPNSSATWTGESAAQLRQLAMHKKVVAIGEIGLDYYRDRAPKEVQQHVFRQQLAIAGELELPVIIHTRNLSQDARQATEDMMKILAEWRDQLFRANSQVTEHPGVLHSFSDNKISALQAVELGFYLGISGPITYKNAVELQEVVAAVPLEHLLLETDSPFLTPHPYRGQRNEPAYVKQVAGKIADIHRVSLETVADTTTRNAENLFHW
jgi:TatD DNase family protein